MFSVLPEVLSRQVLLHTIQNVVYCYKNTFEYQFEAISFAVCHSQYYWNKFVQIVAKTLKLCNDVESNPGPSKSERDQTQFETFCEAYKKAHSSLFKKEAQKKAICHM